MIYFLASAAFIYVCLTAGPGMAFSLTVLCLLLAVLR